VTLPRFTTGSYGRITAANLNEVFDAVEQVRAVPRSTRSSQPRLAETCVARIVGLTTDAVQGVGQSTTVSTSGATARAAWLYNWEEVQLGVADFEATPGTGSCVSVTGDGQVVGGIRGEVNGETIYVPAVDFTPEPRLLAGDLVLLRRVLIRQSSKYHSMWAIVSLLEPTTFLARLTSKHATVDGVYFFAGVTASVTQIIGASTGNRPAINLYEVNAIRDADASYASVLTNTEGANTTTYSGSDNWGHGQSLTGAGATVTKTSMPVGNAGTGSIVVMHRALVHYAAGTPRTADRAYFAFYAVPPVTAACD